MFICVCVRTCMLASMHLYIDVCTCMEPKSRKRSHPDINQRVLLTAEVLGSNLAQLRLTASLGLLAWQGHGTQ